MSHVVGEILEGKITGIQAYGAFVYIDEKTSGLIHISEISDGFVRDVEHYVKVGDRIRVKVLEVDESGHQLRLSLKAVKANSRKSRPRLKSYISMKQPLGFSSLKNKLDQWIAEGKKK